jgi:hypothetical protein
MYDTEDEVTTRDVYETDPYIRINKAIVNRELPHSWEWIISGFIDMDGRFFDHDGIYRLFMEDKSFTMYIDISRIPNRIRMEIRNVKTLSDLLKLGNVNRLCTI